MSVESPGKTPAQMPRNDDRAAPSPPRSTDIARSIEAHGVVGDQCTAALIADDGTVDFLCWPALDSPTVFAALLDTGQGGAWELAPVLTDARRHQTYLPETNVLRTVFAGVDGSAEIIDFMPFPEPGGRPRLVRRVRSVRGELRFRLRCAPRFDYARGGAVAESADDGSVLFRAAVGHDPEAPVLRLIGTVPLTLEGTPEPPGRGNGGSGGSRAAAVAVAEFVLRPGEGADFMLLDGAAAPADLANPERPGAEPLLRACVAHWQTWVGRMKYTGRWREMVTRSALALKLLVSERHGSIAAAVTFGLPESPGGSRNWDYRATWVRDASFTVYAFMRLGYVDEANAFMRWIGGRIGSQKSDGSIQIMYGLDGRTRLDEAELANLAGYGGAGPVRIGNAAYTQVQLDIYGELLDAGYLASKYGDAIPQSGWEKVLGIVEYVCAHWRDPDQGIWEMRGPARHWLHSRLMCWVAIDRAARLAMKRSLPAPLARWHAVRDEIHTSIWADFWDARRGHFVASTETPPDGPSLDAAMLLMPLVRFVSGTDPQWLATLDAIGTELAEGPLVYRYRSADGLQGREGAFTACSFWYAECLARGQRFEAARHVFDATLAYANPLGLLSEEIGQCGEPLGNTPQALTHLALISAAFYLDRELSGPRAGSARPYDQQR